jgi:hypothetical protein
MLDPRQPLPHSSAEIAAAKLNGLQFFAGYPDFNETIHRRHHEGLILQLLLDHRQRLFSETFTELLNTLPRVLYVVDSDFAVIETKYCPTYVSAHLVRPFCRIPVSTVG